MELYLIRVENEPDFGPEYLQAGFDAAMDFQPLLMGEFNKWWKNLPFRIMNWILRADTNGLINILVIIHMYNIV